MQLDPAIVRALFAGPLRLFFLACGVGFLAGVLLFGVSSLRAGVFSRAAVLLYVVGFVPYSLSPFFPAPVVTLGQAIGAVGIILLGCELWRGEGDRREESGVRSQEDTTPKESRLSG